jgi:hypothetical protein
MNLQQRELAESLVSDVLQHFPNAEFYAMHPSPENQSDIWLEFLVNDEESQWQVLEYASQQTTDVLTKFGYKFSPIPLVRTARTA